METSARLRRAYQIKAAPFALCQSYREHLYFRKSSQSKKKKRKNKEHTHTHTQTSHVIKRPVLVTPIFWVRPRETWSTSVLSIGRRRGVEMPLPHVYTEDSGRECTFPGPKPTDLSVSAQKKQTTIFVTDAISLDQPVLWSNNYMLHLLTCWQELSLLVYLEDQFAP